MTAPSSEERAMVSWRRWALVLLVAVGATGCQNACQEICGRMAKYAEDCGIEISDDEIDTCIDEQAEAEKETLKSCRQNGSSEDIRNTWTCDDLLEYFGGGGTLPPPP
jgi:hypothetical protein